MKKQKIDYPTLPFDDFDDQMALHPVTAEPESPLAVQDTAQSVPDLIITPMDFAADPSEPTAFNSADMHATEAETAVSEEKAYSRRISRAKFAEINESIRNFIFIAKRYRDPHYTAQRLADDIKTNTRYLSAAIRFYYNCSYTDLVNRLRIDDAKEMLSNPLCTMTIEEVALSSGFSSRQSFYNAFTRHVGVTPKTFIDNRRGDVLSFV